MSNTQRPNVLFILSDDQRFDTIGALGNPLISTPTLDGLANGGFAAYRQFCTTPICTPARAEILTGCNSFTNGVPWFGMPIKPELTLLPRTFRDAILCEFYSPEEPGQPLRHTQRAVRTEQWKLTWYPQVRRFQLFDLERDPCELVDLLAPWRVHRRAAAAQPNAKLWGKDLWAAPDLLPPYTKSHVDEVAHDLHRRMLELMDAQGDPLPAELRPPSPVEP